MGLDVVSASLGTTGGIDVCAALGAALPCASLVCMIDQAVTQNASGTNTILGSLRSSLSALVTRPAAFFGGRAFLAVAGVYGGTYIAANFATTWSERRKRDPALVKLGATSAVNIGLGVTKDSLFAIWFGQGGAKGGSPLSFPAASWAIFIARDVLTVGAGFVFPGIASKYLQERGTIKSAAVADIVAQLTVPMAFQSVLTPMHLTALDIYNRPGKSMADRARYVASIFSGSIAIRVCRVGIVYGIGGIGNKFIRGSLRERAAA